MLLPSQAKDNEAAAKDRVNPTDELKVNNIPLLLAIQKAESEAFDSKFAYNNRHPLVPLKTNK